MNLIKELQIDKIDLNKLSNNIIKNNNNNNNFSISMLEFISTTFIGCIPMIMLTIMS